MAYIDSKTTAKIRAALKVQYPEIKFSVSMENHMALRVVILKSPHFTEGVIETVNTYWYKSHYMPKQQEVLQGILETIKTVGEWFDKSDIMTDYHNTAFFITLKVGTHGKPHANNSEVTPA